MPNHHRAKLLLTLLSLASLAMVPLQGCAFLKKTIGWGLSRPQVKVHHLTIKKASFQGLELEAGVSVLNPNPFDLTFANLRYDLFINEQLLAQGEYKEQLTIPADNTLQVNLPITIDLSRSLQILKQMLDSKNKAMAKWQAVAAFVSPVGDIEVAFADERLLSQK